MWLSLRPLRHFSANLFHKVVHLNSFKLKVKAHHTTPTLLLSCQSREEKRADDTTVCKTKKSELQVALIVRLD